MMGSFHLFVGLGRNLDLPYFLFLFLKRKIFGKEGGERSTQTIKMIGRYFIVSLFFNENPKRIFVLCLFFILFFFEIASFPYMGRKYPISRGYTLPHIMSGLARQDGQLSFLLPTFQQFAGQAKEPRVRRVTGTIMHLMHLGSQANLMCHISFA